MTGSGVALGAWIPGQQKEGSCPSQPWPALRWGGGSFTSLSPAHGGQPSLAVNTAEAEGW